MIAILWDASPLWGHLILNTVIQTGLPYEVITAKECQENILKDKDFRLLVVPGGSGRQKTALLGEGGVQAIRSFVADGGTYLGFCGGAGLALADGLALCPWGRDFYEGKTEHRISGHIHCDLTHDEYIPEHSRTACIPVWWPGRFAEPSKEEIAENPEKGKVRVLARYREMGKDLYSHDIALKNLPPDTLEDWEHLYGIRLKPRLLDGQPAIIAGNFGKGQYILSYSHLETPDSPDASALFAHILRIILKDVDTAKLTSTCASFEAKGYGLCKNVLNTEKFAPVWIDTDKNPAFRTSWPILRELYGQLLEVFQLGEDLQLLFKRNDWLYGWNTSVHGSQLNALRLALGRALALPPSDKREEFLLTKGLSFAENMLLFVHGAKSWLLARRLCDSINSGIGENEAMPPEIMEAQRRELFGALMYGGGRCGELIAWLDEFLLLGKKSS